MNQAGGIICLESFFYWKLQTAGHQASNRLQSGSFAMTQAERVSALVNAWRAKTPLSRFETPAHGNGNGIYRVQ